MNGMGAYYMVIHVTSSILDYNNQPPSCASYGCTDRLYRFLIDRL